MPKKTTSTSEPAASRPAAARPKAKKISRSSDQTAKPVASKLSTKERIALKIGCPADQLLVYRTEADGMIVAIGPDGRKYKFYVAPGTSRKGLLDASVQPENVALLP